jgi:hypothetical protein
VVRVDEDVYVRSVNGRTSDWFRGTQRRHEGRIRAGGLEKDVTFVEADADLEPRRDGLLVPAGRAHAQRSDATDQLLATGLAEDGEHVRRALS